MRIAVPSDDRTTIAKHFGKTHGFLLFDVRDGVVVPAGYRSMEEPAQDCICPSDRPLRHQRVLDALSGTSQVIAHGMGAHMYDDLTACGISVALTDVGDAKAAVEALVAGQLTETDELACDN